MAAQLLELVTRVILHEERVSAHVGVLFLRFERLRQLVESFAARLVLIRVLVRFGQQLIRVGFIPLRTKNIVVVVAGGSHPLLTHLKGHAVLNFERATLTVETANGPTALVPIHVRERGIRVRLTQLLVVDNAVILLRERILIVVTPQALFIVRVNPKLQHTGRRVNVILGQLSAVNLRNHAQRLTLLIGRRRLPGRQVRTATKLGGSLRQGLGGNEGLQGDSLLTGALLVEQVNNVLRLLFNLLKRFVVKHFRVSSLMMWRCESSTVSSRRPTQRRPARSRGRQAPPE